LTTQTRRNSKNRSSGKENELSYASRINRQPPAEIQTGLRLAKSPTYVKPDNFRGIVGNVSGSDGCLDVSVRGYAPTPNLNDVLRVGTADLHSSGFVSVHPSGHNDVNLRFHNPVRSLEGNDSNC